ncbi:MAG: hypothetical protein ABIO70_26450 [Pseudomonadota bacterium]
MSRRGFTIMEMAINLSILGLLLPLIYAGALALEETHAIALWHLQTAAELRTVADELHRDVRWGRPLADEPLGWSRDDCAVRYRLEAGAVLRVGEGSCEGRQALATGVTALRREVDGVVIEKGLPLRPGLTQRDRVFIPLETP